MNLEYKSMSDHDEDKYEKVMPQVKMFLKDFPTIKLQLVEQIKELRCSADKIDKIHKDCTITSIVTGSASAVSGIMTIAAFALAPMTGGVSLGLCMGSMGLGIAATVANVSAGITDRVSDLQGRRQLDNVEEKISDMVRLLITLANAMRSMEKIFKNIPNFHSVRLLKDKRGLISTTKELKNIFTGTVSSMTKKARLRGYLFAGISVGRDIISIMKNSKHLSKGAKAPTAAELREKAGDLEKKLQKLSHLYETLLKMETQLTA